MSAIDLTQSKNFAFLAEHDPLFVQLACAAERAFSSDPNTTLIKLRQLGEALAQHIASISGVAFTEQTTQLELVERLGRELNFEPAVRQLFRTLRVEGNRATHQFKTRHKEAMDGLRVARCLAVWFHRAFGRNGAQFKAGRFQAPEDPSKDLHQLHEKIAQLRSELTEANVQLDSSQKLNDLIAQEKSDYESLALAMDEEARANAAQVAAHEQALQETKRGYEDKIQALQKQLTASEAKERVGQRKEAVRKTRAVKLDLDLDEDLTRILIDRQLTDAGWEVDTEELRYAKGARPEKGINRAIAEWPTNKGRADYVLFVGLMPIAVVEAKRKNKNVAGKIPQAEGYSRNIVIQAPLTSAWEFAGRTIAWPDNHSGHYLVPFVYSGNGRPYLPQIQELSGIWFRDVRSPRNRAHALPNFHSPQGLLDRLQRSKQDAEDQLKREPFGYLKLRDYQEKAILAAEAAITSGQRRALLAMATGTGKTRTVIGLMYRLLKAERFNRILFLVDRTALGEQAQDAFKEAPLEQNHPISKIYNLAELGDMAVEAETRIQVATVQAMVSRLFASETPPTVDHYDCLIVDEAHRGYTLDQEMTEGELATRDASQYLSSYRRVLDYFDAVKVGLTATPAKHTSEIFGKPVYTYSYREAVADDWLIDHEPPIRYQTLLSKNGITFAPGSTVETVDTQTGEIDSAELEDELHFDVDAFNRRVINENFDRVICEQLAQELDPLGGEKTLIFCTTDSHADRVKSLLDQAFGDYCGDDYNQAAVAKITGQSPSVKQLIRQYKNERYPNIAITVDLLSTGIDVPKICNLVFMRRVRSRILYEQMIGRATRRCDEIGKTVFRIYDPVDIYAALQNVNTMKPLVKDPNITLEQLAGELTDPEQLQRALQSPGEPGMDSQADVVLSQLSQKLMRVLRKAENSAEKRPALREKLNELEQSWGVPAKSLHSHLHGLGPHKAAEFLNQHGGLLHQLAEVKALLGSERHPVISTHADEVLERSQGYGEHSKPEVYLDSFTRFIGEQINESAAITVVAKRPRDLTRAQLKEIKLLLDSHGYTEAKLQAAVRSQTNRDIAASIIGHIRRAALGEALVPFAQRVAAAMEKIYARHPWKTAQRRWLERLAKQLTHEVIIDRDTIDKLPAFQGGARQLDKVLDDQLDTVLEELNMAVWATPKPVPA
ncbi:type I restriction-modification system endonuclease [Microbulbifer sp. VAAF005]|uniref:type I restriction-modification system endonuclease n=1 Tax=Microbulbifer sp. VAAF005 TaxID=3034230 RepID=UPI0024ADA8DF|nr:type I restriction-modification system endonuclease [Microbulbifer sp. VAAF005]WHI45599.1 type I restriction-modification system endonuclease [Microbulbifer sp. VAAF005]